MQKLRTLAGILLTVATTTGWVFGFSGREALEKFPPWTFKGLLVVLGVTLLLWDRPWFQSALTSPLRSYRYWNDRRKSRITARQLRGLGLTLSHNIAKWDANNRQQAAAARTKRWRLAATAVGESDRSRLWHDDLEADQEERARIEGEFKVQYAGKVEHFLREMEQRGYELGLSGVLRASPPYAGVDPFGELARSIEALARQLPR